MLRARIETPERRPAHAADRAYQLRADRGTKTADPAGWRAHGGLGDRQCRGVGPGGADAAHRAHPAGGRLAEPRHPQLGVARIRQPGRVLALRRGVRRIVDPRFAVHQRRCGDRLPANRRGGARPRLGVHRPRLHPAQHAEGRGRAPGHPPDDRGDRGVHRKAAARLARPRADRDLGDPRHPGRGGLRIRRRLGARRRAGDAQDARRADRQHPLYSTSPIPRNATTWR